MAAIDQVIGLDRSPDAVPKVRHFVATALNGSVPADLADDAQLVATELVTNAVLYGAAPVALRVAEVGGTVRIEVADANPVWPIVGLGGIDAMTGRGLALVGRLARAWGVEPGAAGKTVWAELSPNGAALPASTLDPEAVLAAWDDRYPGAERFTIELGDVPTDLLLAAKAHVDNVVRELTLARAGEASGSTARVPAPLATLITAVTSEFADARGSIKRQAIAAAQRGEDRTRLVLELPVSAADAGEQYLAALDAIDGYARAARLLTLESPPQHRVFRRWYVEALVEALRRAARGEPPLRPQPFEQRLLAELGSVTAAQRASAHAARLQAVTAALAAAVTAEDVAAVVLSEGVAALGASGGGIVLPGAGDTLVVPGTVGYGDNLQAFLRAERRDAGLPAATTLRTGEPVWLESPHERDLRFPELRGLEPDTVSLCAVPLVVRDEVLGAIRFSFDLPRLFDEDERQFVHALAAQTAQALDRARLYAAEQTARRRAAFLAEASHLLTSSLDPEDTVAHVVDLVVPTLADKAEVTLDGGLPPVGADLVVPLVARGERLGTLALFRASGTPFDLEERRLLEDVAARAAAAVLNAQRYARERDAALTLQRSLLPQRLPRVPGLQFAWRYLPGGTGVYVGGDWYDVIPLGEGAVGMVIGDVMGRGVHAAAVMGQLRATARAYATAHLPPAEILTRLDDAVGGLEQGQITTALYGVLHPVSGHFTFASAGHLPPLLVDENGAEFLGVDPGPPLGAGAPAYVTRTVALPRGATLLLYTDGLVEDHGHPVDEGMATLRESVRDVSDPEQLCDRALAALGRDHGHDDDTAILAVHLDG